MPDLIVWGVMELEKLKGDVDTLVYALCRDFGLTPETCREAGLRVMEADEEWVVICPPEKTEPREP